MANGFHENGQANYRSPKLAYSPIVTLGHVLQLVMIMITAGSIVVTGVMMMGDLRAENDVQDVRISNLEIRLDRNITDIKGQLNRIEVKVDEKADK